MVWSEVSMMTTLPGSKMGTILRSDQSDVSVAESSRGVGRNAGKAPGR